MTQLPSAMAQCRADDTVLSAMMQCQARDAAPSAMTQCRGRDAAPRAAGGYLRREHLGLTYR